MDNISFDTAKAARYEEYARTAVFGYDELFVMILSLLAQTHDEAAEILVMGSGTGKEIITFGSRMPHWQLTGVDPSEEMIHICKANIVSHGLADRVTLHHGYIETLSEEKFNAATLIYVLRFLPEAEDRLSLLRHIGQRVHSGGTLVIVDQCGDPASVHTQSMIQAWRSFMTFRGASVELANAIAKQAADKLFLEEKELQKMLFDSGFGEMHRFYSALVHSGWAVQKK